MRWSSFLRVTCLIVASLNCNGLRIIGAGFGRTGTKSLQKALHILGFKCYHAEDMVKHILDGHLDYWYEVGTSKDPSTFNFSKIYDEHGYDATVDFPSCLYFQELGSFYKDAKVVLSIRRNATAWYNSAKRVSLAFHPSLTLDTGRYLFYHWNPLGRYIFRSLNASYLQHFADVSNEEATKAQYIDWTQKVQREVPASKLLVFNVEEGWDPLCQFLDVEVPNQPFPRAVEYMHIGDLVLAGIGWLTVAIPSLLVLCCGMRTCHGSKAKLE